MKRKKKRFLQKKSGEEEGKKEKLLMGATVAFSVVAAVAIFMVLPYFSDPLS